MENIKNRKLLIIIMVILLITVIGVSLAAYTYFRQGTENVTLVTGDIYMHYTESNTLTMTNEMPRTSYDSNKYFEFSVVGKNTYTEKDIIYEVVISHGANHATRQTRLEDKFLRFRLEEKIGNGNFQTVITEGSYPDFASGERIWVDTIDRNTTSDVTHTYRLYIWISNEVGIGNTNITDYDLNTWNTDVYATIKVDVTGDFTEKELETSLKDKISELKTSNASYVKSYNTEIIANNPTFTTQDTVGTNSNKQDVLYFTGADALTNGNVLFAGYCWQIMRTTDTGGVRLLYNGLAVNNQCKTDRSEQTFRGVVAALENAKNTNISSETIFGKSYDYNLSTNTFTIMDILTGKNWTNNSSELIGTYSCLNGTTSCENLYYIGIKVSDTNAYISKYIIDNIDGYAQIGRSFYNNYVLTMSSTGYMFNKSYFSLAISSEPTGTFANDVTWNGVNYVLSNNTSNSLDATHHYQCNNEACTQVKYFYFQYTSGTSTTYWYIILENGKKVEDALKDMINYKSNPSDSDEEINVYPSSMKGYIDNWYKKNIAGTASEKYLDTMAVYCNDRSVYSLGGWNKSNSLGNLSFYRYYDATNLICMNITDRFSMSNMKANLTYPVGLITAPERVLMGNSYAASTSNAAILYSSYWTSTPIYFDRRAPFIYSVNTSGSTSASNPNLFSQVRPVVTLSPSALITEGDGGYETPYVVGPLVTRTN